MKKKNNNRGQRSQECAIVGCNEKGRVLARLGDKPISYCPMHRKKYGERIINALINSCFNYKLSNFLSEVKDEIFMGSAILSTDSRDSVGSYIIMKTERLEALLKYQQDNDASVDESDLK